MGCIAVEISVYITLDSYLCVFNNIKLYYYSTVDVYIACALLSRFIEILQDLVPHIIIIVTTCTSICL